MASEVPASAEAAVGLTNSTALYGMKAFEFEQMAVPDHLRSAGRQPTKLQIVRQSTNAPSLFKIPQLTLQNSWSENKRKMRGRLTRDLGEPGRYLVLYYREKEIPKTKDRWEVVIMEHLAIAVSWDQRGQHERIRVSEGRPKLSPDRRKNLMEQL